MKQTDIQIIIGSKSDESRIKDALDVLSEFEIPFNIKVASAHRSPVYVDEVIDSAINSGVKVFITGAGMANHLSGTVASRTTLPVIGIPFSGGLLDGLDALLSTAQMPPGVPVATVAVNGAKNAAILALEILSIKNKEIQKKLINYRHKETEKIKNAV